MPPDQEQSIRKQYKKLGRPLPKYILDKPKLGEDGLFAWSCFWELSTERYPSQVGVTSIPICKIYEYLNHLLVPDFYKSVLVYCIRQLDMHYVKDCNDSLKQMKKK